MRVHVLDANAFYRLMIDEKGSEIVANIFKQAAASSTPVLMSVIAWGEVYYTLARRIGLVRAENSLNEARRKTGLQLVAVDEPYALKAARLKAQHNIPYADAFTAALAGTQNICVTADEEHFRRIPKLRLLKLPSHRRN